MGRTVRILAFVVLLGGLAVAGSILGRYVGQQKAAADHASSGHDDHAPLDVPEMTLRPGDPFPNLELHDGAGNVRSLHELALGRPTLVVVAAAGCDACRVEVERWHEVPLHDRTVLGVSLEPRETIEEFFGPELPFPIYTEPTATLQSDFGVVAVPTTIGLASDGSVAVVFDGELGHLTPSERIAYLREHHAGSSTSSRPSRVFEPVKARHSPRAASSP